jgi:hypothetical protein
MKIHSLINTSASDCKITLEGDCCGARIVMREYTSEDVSSGQRGICHKCKLPPSPEGHDGCLGTLPGPIMNACCGHGSDRQAYIQYWGGNRISGKNARSEQGRLLAEQNEVAATSGEIT